LPSDCSIPAALTGMVFNTMRFALHDGPGIRTTVFLKGCPLECGWCHNPESQSFAPSLMLNADRCRQCGDCVEACPHHAAPPPNTDSRCILCGACAGACLSEARHLSGRELSVAQLLAEVERDRPFFDESGGGVTLSGGEPLAQPLFASAFLAAARARGIHTALDTCGYAPPDTFQHVAAQADLVLYDLKLIDSDAHRHYTGRPNDWILLNLQSLALTARPLIVRSPLIPDVNDSPADLDALSAFLLSCGLHRLDLLPYHDTGQEKRQRLGLPAPPIDLRPPSPQRVEEAATRLRGAGLKVFIGGIS
jgi:pyruvate formate lyase activating enzyme